MSPKSLVALLLVGLCATQMVSAYRHSREVEQLLGHAEEKLGEELATKEDAARSSMETVMGFLQKMEKMVLEAGTKKLAELGYPIDLITVSELMKSNCNECVTNDAVRAAADSVISEMSSCVSTDMDSLKGLLKNMQGLWSTASNIPSSMMNIATQCSEHGDHDIKEDALEPAHAESAESDESDESDKPHDLDPVADEIAEEAAKSRSKRWIWGLSRITRCVKSVYSLAKNDLITIPGQMLSCATNAFNVMKTAASSAEIPVCLKDKTTTVLPMLKSVSYDVATCLAKFDVDKIIAGNTKLVGLKKMMDFVIKMGSAPSGALEAVSELANGGVAGALGTVSNMVANGGVTGVLGTLGSLANGGAAAATGATGAAAGAIDAATGGVAGAAVGAATGVAGSAVGAATGAAGAAVGAATGVAGAATGAVKGITGRILG